MPPIIQGVVPPALFGSDDTEAPASAAVAAAASTSNAANAASEAAALEAQTKTAHATTAASASDAPQATSSSSAQARSVKRRSKRDKNNKNKDNFLLRDSFLVEIPLHMTVDLGELFCQGRTRYLRTIYERFPQLLQENTNMKEPPPSSATKNNDEEEDEDMMEATDVDSKKKKKTVAELNKKSQKKKPPPPTPNKHMPHPSDFGNVLEYLEAKYVQGVMVDAEDLVAKGGKGGEGDDDGEGGGGRGDHQEEDEGAGSVYSESSFLDDTDLQRSIAHQVLAHSTATKLELTDEDNEFFVNVGNLEVEESEFTKEHYDPLKDVDQKKTKKFAKKRKKPADGTTSTACNSTVSTGAAARTTPSTTAGAASTMKKTTSTSATAAAPSSPGKNGNKLQNPKKKAKIEAAVETTTTSTEKPKKKEKIKAEDAPATASSGSASPPPNPMTAYSSITGVDASTLKKIAAQRKELVDHLYDHLIELIPKESFPKRKTKERVAVTCPSDKKPGDSILFSNPHVPGQRLKVQIPKNTQPGGTFKVTVPVKEELDENADYNKLSREFHDTLDDYARAYDDWCDAEGAYRRLQNADSDYTAHFEKRKKFDALLLEFPQELKTPVDPNYIKKILRRARQNRSKREQTAARQQEKVYVGGGSGLSVAASTSGGGSDNEEISPAPAAVPKPKSKSHNAKAGAAASLTNSSSKNKQPSPPPPPLSESASPEPPTKTKPVVVPSLYLEFETKRFDLADFE